MTLFLASVRDAAEAETALAAGADIIDLKDPAKGTLGAVGRDTLIGCVKAVAGRAKMSATVGDLPMQARAICDAVRATAASGVDYVKLGLFPDGDAQSCLSVLAAETLQARLILVAFADALPAFEIVAAAAAIGAHGVMLDTAGKGGGSLPDHAASGQLARFVAAAKANGLLVGLAGSLKRAHVAPLLRLQPDLLGFRGALCRGGARDAALDPEACAEIRALIPRQPDKLTRTDMPHLAPYALC